MTSAFASFARKSSMDVKLKSGASPMEDASCTVQPKDASPGRINGSILEPHWFPISSIQIGGALQRERPRSFRSRVARFDSQNRNSYEIGRAQCREGSRN